MTHALYSSLADSLTSSTGTRCLAMAVMVVATYSACTSSGNSSPTGMGQSCPHTVASGCAEAMNLSRAGTDRPQ
jgi:hypothetical protein